MKNKIYTYTAVFEPAEEGGYTVSIPSLPGCISEGDTFEEALKNIKEAASLYLETEDEQREERNEEREPIIAPVRITA